MSVRVRLAPIAAALLGMALLHGQAPTKSAVNVLGGVPQGPEVPPRRPASDVVAFRPHQDILSRMAPEQTHITVVLDQDNGLRLAPPEGMSHIEFWTRNADAVGVFRVSGRTGALSKRRDWVFSTVQAEVVDVLKPDADQRIAAGQAKIQFRISGGAATIGNKHIDAVISNVRPLNVGATYLLSLELIDNDWFFASDTSFQYEVIDSRLEAVDSRSRPTALQGMDVSDAAERIRAASTLEPLAPKRRGDRR